MFLQAEMDEDLWPVWLYEHARAQAELRRQWEADVREFQREMVEKIRDDVFGQLRV